MNIFDILGKQDENAVPLLMKKQMVAQNEPPLEMEPMAVEVPMPPPGSNPRRERLPAATPEEMDMEKIYKGSIDERKKLLDALKKKLEDTEASAPTGIQAMNLKPFAAAVDAITGSHMAQNYGPSEDKADYKEKLKALGARVDKQENELNDDQLNYLKMKMQEKMYGARADKEDVRLAKQGQQMEFKLRNEWDSDPITKNTKAVNEGLAKIESAYHSNDPADYMTMIYGLMKMQDPASSVKEGEFKSGEGIGGWPEKWQAAFQNARGAGAITQKQKDSIMLQARQIHQAQMARQAEVDNTYTEMSNRYNFNPDNVVLKKIFNKGNKVQVTNGVETLSIPAEDLQQAIADGYQQVK